MNKSKKQKIEKAYRFAFATKRVLLLLCAIVACVMLPTVLTTATITTFVNMLYVTSPIWLMYFVAEGACLILDALY